MRILFILTLFIFEAGLLKSQNLEGLWKGEFKSSEDSINIPSTPISLAIEQLPDSTYFIRTINERKYYYKGKYYLDSIFWKVDIKFITNDSIVLKEVSFLSSSKSKEMMKILGDEAKQMYKKYLTGCPQKFRLKLIETTSGKILQGFWSSNKGYCNDSGTITFEKVTD